MTISGSSGLIFPDGSGQETGIGRNRIINGAMVIDQRNDGASVTPTADSTYSLDRWVSRLSVTSKYSVQQNAGSITPPTGFSKYLGITSLSAYTVGVAESFSQQQKIEGFNVADLDWGTANAKTVTLSFWVRSSLTGTFGGALLNENANRSYPFSYTISVANTWELKSVTIAGDTTGTWVGATNGVGMFVSFGLGTGSTLSATAGAWYGTTYLNATGATSVVGTNGATFYITGVQLEQNTVATPFERRLYDKELISCQRYYQKINGYIETNADATHFAYSNWLFKVSMRASPTVTNTSGTGTLYNYSVDGVSSYAVQYSSIYQNATASAEL